MGQTTKLEYLLLGSDGKFRGANGTRVRRDRATCYSAAAATWLQTREERLVSQTVEVKTTPPMHESPSVLASIALPGDDRDFAVAWARVSAESALALARLAEDRLVELEQHGYQEMFDGERDGLRALGEVLERGRGRGLLVTGLGTTPANLHEVGSLPLVGSISAEEWNEVWPKGTEVIFFPVVKEGRPVVGPDSKPQHTKTRSEAWMLGEHAVVSIEGRAGGVAISHLAVLTAKDGPK